MTPSDDKLHDILLQLADLCDERADRFADTGFDELEVCYFATSDQMRTLAWTIREHSEKKETRHAEIPFDVAGEGGGTEKEGSHVILSEGGSSGGLAAKA